jgi:CrcB protein
VSAGILVCVGLAGGLGACARFALDGAVTARAGLAFPWGTLVVNVLGSFLLGLLAGVALGADARRIAATGLLGAFTTFSTWVFASERLAVAGHRRAATLNVVVSLALGLGAVWLGRIIGAAL